jgi:ubiquitin carboxyl-terminal hydrolase 36/42
MKIPVFINLGNTCYVNSVLQCFIYNTQLKNLNLNNNEFITEFNKITNLVDKTENGQYIAVIYNLSDFIKCLPFKKFEQQDAHEFILFILDCITFNENKELYHGTTRTDIHCLTCQTIKNVFEDFNSINLSIPPFEKSCNITQLLIKYFENERSENNENLYFCEKCNSLNDYEKKIILHKLPETLIIVLKRYTETGTKIITEVEIDNVLKIKEHSSSLVKTYRLSSTINHVGNLYNGHYTNFIYINNKWMHVDDQVIKAEPFNYKNCYILFYDYSSSE